MKQKIIFEVNWTGFFEAKCFKSIIPLLVFAVNDELRNSAG